MAIMSVKIHGGLSHQALNNNGATIIGSGWRRFGTGWMMTVRLATCTVDVFDQSALPWKDTNREEMKDPIKLEKLLTEKLSKKEREIAEWRPQQQQGPSIDYDSLFNGFFESMKPAPAPAPAAPQIDVDAIKVDAAIEAAKAAIAAVMPVVQAMQQEQKQTAQQVTDLIAALQTAQQSAPQQPVDMTAIINDAVQKALAAQQSAQTAQTQQTKQQNTQTKP